MPSLLTRIIKEVLNCHVYSHSSNSNDHPDYGDRQSSSGDSHPSDGDRTIQFPNTEVERNSKGISIMMPKSKLDRRTMARPPFLSHLDTVKSTSRREAEKDTKHLSKETMMILRNVLNDRKGSYAF